MIVNHLPEVYLVNLLPTTPGEKQFVPLIPSKVTFSLITYTAGRMSFPLTIDTAFYEILSHFVWFSQELADGY